MVELPRLEIGELIILLSNTFQRVGLPVVTLVWMLQLIVVFHLTFKVIYRY